MTKMLSGLSKQKGRLGHSPGALELGALGPLPSSTRRSWIPFGATSHVQKVAILRRGIWVVFALALMALTAQSRLSTATSPPAAQAYPTPGPASDPVTNSPPTKLQPSRDSLWQMANWPVKSSTEHSDLPAGSSTHAQKGHREIDISSDALPISATLAERLEVWRRAPGGRGEVEGEVELGGFNSWNLEQCDTISEQHNTHMIQFSANVWGTMNRTTVHERRTELINHLGQAEASGLLADHGSGRGIVMVAGNADTLQRVIWSLEMLRSYNSTLPVQIWCFPSEMPEKDDPIHSDLAELGAEIIAAKGYEKTKGKSKSYHLKAVAILQCPWREILYLDSDSIPVRDPDYMFDAPNYQRLGIWATPDYWKTSANTPIWAIMGVKCRNEWEMETGQMFIDKSKHMDTFKLIQYMLEHHDYWFYFSDGDKDIFRWAMLALRKRWAVPGRWVGAAALPWGTASGDFCAHTMLQHDSWGEPLFVHYNLLKHIPSGVGRGYSWGKTKQLPMFDDWPGTPATSRLSLPEGKGLVEQKGSIELGDVDCDMLADADEYGRARSAAGEAVMRRAVRERGVKVKYHGGVYSALCIDLEYIDPRPQERKDADAALKVIEDAAAQALVEAHQGDGEPAAVDVEDVDTTYLSPPRPDWSQSPIHVVQWSDDENLKDFEQTLYDFGFNPSGKGF